MFKDIVKKYNNCWLLGYCFRANSLFRDLKGEWVDMAALANNIITWKAIKLHNVASNTDYSKAYELEHEFMNF